MSEKEQTDMPDDNVPAPEGSLPEGSQPDVPPAQESPLSGSRWEGTDPAPLADPVAASTSAPEVRSRWLSGRVALVGAGLGLALVAGAGGFAIGAAAADDDDDHSRFQSERRWEGEHDDDRHHEMPRHAPGGEGFGPGDRPDFGQPMDPDQYDDSDSDDSDQDDSSTQG